MTIDPVTLLNALCPSTPENTPPLRDVAKIQKKCHAATNGKFVLLKGRELGNTFFCDGESGKDPRFSINGEHWYDILGYADTVAEAQIALYGRSYEM